MKVALFGGTFDPVHVGHLAAARAAQSAFGLDQIHFIPAQRPPHKDTRAISAFTHRYAMLALACSANPAFIPSLLEQDGTEGPNYSIETVRRFANVLSVADRLHFMVGVDSFLDIRSWKDPAALLDSCDFIVVSRPGYAIEKIAAAIPDELRAPAAAPSATRCIVLRRTSVWVLDSVHEDVSASEVRRRAARQQPLCGLVPDAVAEYISKTGLYADA